MASTHLEFVTSAADAGEATGKGTRMEATWSREVALTPNQAALLFVDVQNYAVHRDGGEVRNLAAVDRQRFAYYFERLETVALPNMQRLQRACRVAGIEVMYTLIENLTADGRDRSLDYKISGIDVAKGSWDARVCDAIAPGEDEIVLTKTSSSVFISTNIDYVLRNLGVRQLVLCGVVTDQCVEIRSARRLRPGISGHVGPRRLRDDHRGAAGGIRAGRRRLLPPTDHDRTARGN